MAGGHHLSAHGREFSSDAIFRMMPTQDPPCKKDPEPDDDKPK